MRDHITNESTVGGKFRYGFVLVVAMVFASSIATAEPMLEWLPGEGLIASQNQTENRPLITISPAGSAAPLPFDLGNLNEFRLELSDTGLSLTTQNYVTRSFTGVEGIGAALLLGSGEAFGWYAGASQILDTSVVAGNTLSAASPGFQPLAQIQCRDGVISAQGYLGQDCRLNRSQSRIEAGLHWQTSDRVVARAGAGLFDESSEAVQPWSLTPWSPLSGMDSRGLNLDLELGLTTNSFGDWTLGVQVARILDGQLSQPFTGAVNANLTGDPGSPVQGFDNSFSSARVGLDWRLGDFGGGINSYYRAPIELRGSEELDELTSFDIYFSWQTPWDGSLRIGASNLTEENLSAMPLAPRTESDEHIYGRIPYVRYRQDL